MRKKLELYKGATRKTLILDHKRQRQVHFGGLAFYYRDDHWYIDLKEYKSDSDKSFEILRSKIYTLKREDLYHLIFLVVKDEIESFVAYKMQDVLISSLKTSEMVTKTKELAFAHIFIKDAKIISDFEYIYLNDHRYDGSRLLDHDRIDILGLTLIYTKDYLFSNNFGVEVDLEEVKITTSVVKEPSFIIERHYRQKAILPRLEYSLRLQNKENAEEAPFIITFGQGLFMSLGMLGVSIVSAYLSYMSGRSLIEITMIVAMPLLMAISAILFPLLQKRYRSRSRKKRDSLKDSHDKEAVDTLIRKIESDIAIIKEYHESYGFTSSDLHRLFADKELFYREKEDEDALYITLARGKKKLDLKIKDEGNNGDKVITELKERYSYLSDVPIIIDLKSYDFLTIRALRKRDEVFLYILLQLALTVSYKDIKIALCIDRAFYERYGDIVDIPHLYDADRRLIFIDESAKVPPGTIILSLYNLNEEIKEESSIIYFSDGDIPKRTKLIIDIDKDLVTITDGCDRDIYRLTVFAYDIRIFDRLRSYRSYDKDDAIRMPVFSDIYDHDIDLAKIYQNDEGIIATLGIDEDRQRLVFDLSQEGIGPHAMLSGCTGAGKSEFLLSLILSLALRSDAKHLNFALIDYKGTGLLEALSYKGETLPHIVLALNNLDEVALDRSLAYFRLECQRREEAFRKLAAITRTSIMDLKDYHRLDPESYGMPYIADEFIIIDEFAELKLARRDFIKDIISIARIGRSLGIMLLLSTQKPSAVVDQEVWANTSYRISLKVQDESDSKEMIGTGKAKMIKRPGEFYLRTKDRLYHGYGTYTRSFKDRRNEEVVELIDHKKETIRSLRYEAFDKERESAFFIKKIIEYHKTHKIHRETIYRPKLEETSFYELYKRYGLDLRNGKILLGEYDDFMMMDQGALIHDLNKDPFLIFSYEDKKKRDLFFRTCLMSLAFEADKYHIFYIGDKKSELFEFENWAERIDVDDVSDIDYLFYRLKRNDLKKKAIVFIEDHLRFLQDPMIKEMFEGSMPLLDRERIGIISASLKKVSLSYKLEALFVRYVLDNKEKDTLLYAFSKVDAVSEIDVTSMGKRLVGFKLASIAKNSFTIKRDETIIKKIPDVIESEPDLLGYDLKTREKLYLRRNGVLFCAYYQEMLERFKRGFNTRYSHDYSLLSDVDRDKYHDTIVWIGPGIINQYLFIPKIKKDLHRDEAYIEISGEAKVIRYVENTF